MSKRWWLPTQKGIEPFPRATVAPPKLKIEGAAHGTPLYALIAERFNGQLKQFHGHCQQDYSLTNNEVMKRRISFGDEAVATYTNLQGQEILELRVSAQVVRELQEEPFSPWDWALLNLKVPDVTTAEFSAFMRVPLLETPYVDAGKGVSVDYGNSGYGRDPMSFPDMTNTQFTELPGPVSLPGESFTAASLLVDLRIVDPHAAVVIDVYGRLPTSGAQCAAQGNNLPVSWTISHPASPPSSDLSGTSIGGPLIDDYPWAVEGFVWLRLPDCTLQRMTFRLGSYPTIDVLGTFPAQLSSTQTIAVSGTSGVDITFSAIRTGTTVQITMAPSEDLGIAIYGTWDPDWTLYPSNFWWLVTVAGKTAGSWNTSNGYSAAGGVAITYSDESGPPADEHDYGFFTADSGNQTDYNYYFVPYTHATSDPTPEDAVDVTAPVIAAGTIGKGSPEWVFSEHQSDISSYHVWESRALFPNPIPTAVLQTNLVISSAVGAQPSPIYNMGKIGTFIADRRFGSIAFNPA